MDLDTYEQFSFISSEQEIKELSEKFKSNGFHISPYRDPESVWDAYEHLTCDNLARLRECSHVAQFGIGRRCHLFLIKLGDENRACLIENGMFFRCYQLEDVFTDELFFGTLFDCELILDRGDATKIIITDVLAIGGVSKEKIEFVKRDPPFAVSVDAKVFPLEQRLEFARALFSNSSYYLDKDTATMGFVFEVQEYAHISEFQRLISEKQCDTVIFQPVEFSGKRYIYHVPLTIAAPDSERVQETREFFVFKNKYPGIWTICDRSGFSAHLYVPTTVMYRQLAKIPKNARIQCRFDTQQKMWTPIL